MLVWIRSGHIADNLWENVSVLDLVKCVKGTLIPVLPIVRSEGAEPDTRIQSTPE